MSNYKRIKVNEPLALSRYENVTTGYKNFIMLSPELKVLYENFKLDNNMPGSGGTRTWTIVGRQPGIYFVSFINMRPWISDIPPCDVIKIEVVNAVV